MAARFKSCRRIGRQFGVADRDHGRCGASPERARSWPHGFADFRKPVFVPILGPVLRWYSFGRSLDRRPPPMRTPDATAARKRATADRHGGIGSRVAPGSVRTVHRPGPIRGTPPEVGNGPTAIGAAPDRDHGGCRPGHAAGAGNEATVIGATPIGSELPTDGPPIGADRHTAGCGPGHTGRP